jgi:hypothetical protein
METGNKTLKYLEMATVKEGNSTLAEDDIFWCVSQIDSRCEWHGVNCDPVILNCRHRMVATKLGYQVEPYPLSSVEIMSSIGSVKLRLW